MLPIPRWLAALGHAVHRAHYRQRFERVYRRTRKPPSWFDHRIDLYYLWPENLFWLERGVLPRRWMRPGCRVLDLFCGDGFFARHFYATAAARVDAVDKDPSAIAHAQREHAHPRVAYHVLDALERDFPADRYDVVVWYEGIEHLSADDCGRVLARIGRAIADGGVLLGSTPLIAPEQRGRNNWEHQNEFEHPDALRAFLGRAFRRVDVFETIYPNCGGGVRRTAHFLAAEPVASDGASTRAPAGETVARAAFPAHDRAAGAPRVHAR